MRSATFRATSPAGIATLLGACLGMAALILLGSFDMAPVLWGILAFVVIGLLMVGGLSGERGLTAERIDQVVWAILICHTLQLAPGRDPRILLEDRSLTTQITIQIVIWILCLAYASVRLLADPLRLRSLIGPAARYSTLFFLAALASSIYAINPLITLAWTVKLLSILALSCVLFDPRNPGKSAERFLAATYLGLLLMLIAFVVFGILWPETAMEQSDSGIWRAGGSLITPTKLSAVAGLVSIMALIDVLSRRKGRLAKPILISSVAIMMSSLGRGGMLAAGIAIVAVLAAFRRTRLAFILGCAVGLLFAASPTLMDASWEILSRRQDLEQITSLTGRIPLWETAIDLIALKPILGWGYVSGSRVAFLLAFKYWPAVDAHNALLQTLLTLGIVGGAIILMLLWKTYAGSIRILSSLWNPARPEPLGIGSLTVLALLLFLTVQGLLESGFSGAPKFETAILVGASLCVDHLRRAARNAS